MTTVSAVDVFLPRYGGCSLDFNSHLYQQCQQRSCFCPAMVVAALTQPSPLLRVSATVMFVSRCGCCRFVVNFQCDSEGETIGFHFNPRQDEEDVVLNARLGGDWGEEQRGFENDFAFKRGEFFDAFFIATEGRFNVSPFGLRPSAFPPLAGLLQLLFSSSSSSSSFFFMSLFIPHLHVLYSFYSSRPCSSLFV